MVDLRRKWSTIPRAAPSPTKQQPHTISRHASPRGGFLFALAASVRPHNTSDSDRRDGNPMATICGGIIGWHKNRILTRRLS